MQGFIDGFDQDRTVIRGWVAPGDEQSSCELKINNKSVKILRLNLIPPTPGLVRLKGQKARQFEIKISHQVNVLDALAGRIHLHFNVTGKTYSVPLSEGLLKRELKILNSELKMLPKDKQLAILAGGVDGSRPMSELPTNTSAPNSGNFLSPVGFPEGMMSADQSVVLGKEGHFFPIGGSNKILSRYGQEAKSVTAHEHEEVHNWIGLIENRSDFASQIDAEFRQLIIPDKLSMLPNLSPFPLGTPTRAFKLLASALADNKNFVTMPPNSFSECGRSERMWKKVDGHPTSYGAYEFSRLIFQDLEIDFPSIPESEFIWPTYQEGPLGQRFFGFPIWDTVLNLQNPEKFGLQSISGQQLRGELGTDKMNPRLGIYYKYNNPNAIDGRTVALVGTSTSGRGTHQSQLTWWFKHAFRQVHFIWNTEIEEDLIRDIGPDILVSQTVERYLSRIPAK